MVGIRSGNSGMTHHGDRVPPGIAALIVLTIVGAGCAGGAPPPNADLPAAGHPWPEVDAWPAGLEGPFGLASLTNVAVPSTGGVTLDAWLLLPDVPDAPIPAVLWSAPYFGLNNQAGNDRSGWDNSVAPEAVPVNLLVENGYAVMILNVRGSGNSGGCYDLFGRGEWEDNAAAVEWLGTQEWSNGRVGMMGLSYHGTTPWQAAVLQPPHLKTIVTAGMISNLYTFFHTPQGAPLTIGPAFGDLLTGIDVAPPLLGTPDQIVRWPLVAPERVCPETLPILTEAWKSAYTDHRDEAFWNERDIMAHFADVQASVLLTHGLLDYHGSGHAQEEDVVWGTLPEELPKRMLLGQWGHMFPNFSPAWESTGRDWNEELLAWLDYWLKGTGPVPELGIVEYQDSSGSFRNSTAWPPTEVRPEALYLSGDALQTHPGTGATPYRARPVLANDDIVCQTLPMAAGLAFYSDVLDEDVTLAGNPYAWLTLTSDMPGGQVAVTLYDAHDLRCEDGQARGMRFLGMGAADLRHHQGNLEGKDFPVGHATQVRIDINNIAEVVEAGHQILAVVSYGDSTYSTPNPYNPTIQVHGASELMLPFIEGGLGGATPSEVPPRPFLPSPRAP